MADWRLTNAGRAAASATGAVPDTVTGEAMPSSGPDPEMVKAQMTDKFYRSKGLRQFTGLGGAAALNRLRQSDPAAFKALQAELMQFMAPPAPAAAAPSPAPTPSPMPMKPLPGPPGPGFGQQLTEILQKQ